MSEPQDEDVLQTLTSLEERAWQALSQGTGADFYRSNLTGGALMVFPFGILTRAQSIEAMEAAPPWNSFRIEHPQVVRLTDDSAILTYRVTAQRSGHTPFAAFLTTVFVKQDGAWKTAFHQQSPPTT